MVGAARQAIVSWPSATEWPCGYPLPGPNVQHRSSPRRRRDITPSCLIETLTPGPSSPARSQADQEEDRKEKNQDAQGTLDPNSEKLEPETERRDAEASTKEEKEGASSCSREVKVSHPCLHACLNTDVS